MSANPYGIVPHEWDNGICSCTSHPAEACLACWCPCIIYGKTSYRQQHGATSSNMDGYKCCNGDCCAFAALAILTGVGSAILQCIRRPNLRDHNLTNISGSGAKDCLCVCCCNCCTLVQEELEMKAWMENREGYRHIALEKSGQPQMREGMAYQAPQQTGQDYVPQQGYPNKA